MAPITDQIVDDLKSTISKLESRISELEGRLVHGGASSSSSQEGVRMILIGPPGAGELLPSAAMVVACKTRLWLTRSSRQGNAGTAD
jgi:hypothetical protein